MADKKSTNISHFPCGTAPAEKFSAALGLRPATGNVEVRTTASGTYFIRAYDGRQQADCFIDPKNGTYIMDRQLINSPTRGFRFVTDYVVGQDMQPDDLQHTRTNLKTGFREILPVSGRLHETCFQRFDKLKRAVHLHC